jgi:hypothetical protein
MNIFKIILTIVVIVEVNLNKKYDLKSLMATERFQQELSIVCYYMTASYEF